MLNLRARVLENTVESPIVTDASLNRAVRVRKDTVFVRSRAWTSGTGFPRRVPPSTKKSRTLEDELSDRGEAARLIGGIEPAGMRTARESLPESARGARMEWLEQLRSAERDYEARPVGAPSAGTSERFRKIEARFGPVPLSVRVFYEVVRLLRRATTDLYDRPSRCGSGCAALGRAA
jgi:hypothetical protein